MEWKGWKRKPNYVVLFLKNCPHQTSSLDSFVNLLYSKIIPAPTATATAVSPIAHAHLAGCSPAGAKDPLPVALTVPVLISVEEDAVEPSAVALAEPVGVSWDGLESAERVDAMLVSADGGDVSLDGWETVERVGTVLISVSGVVLSVSVKTGVTDARVTEFGMEKVVVGALSSWLKAELPVPVSSSVSSPCNSVQLGSSQQPSMPFTITHTVPVSHVEPSTQQSPPSGQQVLSPQQL